MGRRIGWAVLAGFLSAFIAWRICLRYAVPLTLDRSNAGDAISSVFFSTTGGQFYGLILIFTFAFLLCGLCTFIYSSHRSIPDRVGRSLIAAGLGSTSSTLLWYWSDIIVLRCLERQSPLFLAASVARVSLFALSIFVLIYATAMCIDQPRRNWLFMIGASYFISFFLYYIQQIVVAIGFWSSLFSIGSALQKASKNHYRQLPTEFDPGVHIFSLFFLLVVFGLLFGPLMAFIESKSRKAWIKSISPGLPSQTWSIENQIMRIGCSNRCEIRQDQKEDFAPLHAQIQRHGSDYSIVDLGTPGGTYVNGNRVEKAWLKHGDTIRTGFHTFQFNLRDEAAAPKATKALTMAQGMNIVELVTGAGLTDDLGNTYHLQDGKNTIGSAKNCQICLSWEPSVSGLHAQITIDGSDVIIQDLVSATGTFVNGDKITQPQHLSNGDEIMLGSARLKYTVAVNPHAPVVT